jgi:O-antigen/teichoic acid export membrane protein
MRRGFLANSTVWGFVHALSGNATVALAQGLQFLLLARVLGSREFGFLSAASAITSILIPFSGMGAANVLVMRASRDPSVTPVYLGNAWLIMLVTGGLLVVLSAVSTPLLVPNGVSPQVLLVFGLSEIVAAKFVDVAWHVFLARQQMHLVSGFLVAQSVTRLATAILYAALSPHPSAGEWVWWALASNSAVASAVVWITVRKVGSLRADLRLLRHEFGNGIYFAAGLSAKGFYTDADKVLLGRFGDAESLGQYTAAFRLVQIAMMPARALSAVLQNRLFRAGAEGVERALDIVLRLLAPVCLFMAIMAGLYYVCAPLVPLLTGDSYLPSVRMLQFMCLLPLVQAVQSLLHDTLASSGHQRVAAIIQAAAAVSIFGFGVLLVPRMGWRGAALSSYLAQLALCALITLAIVLLRRPGLARGTHASKTGGDLRE